VLVARTVGRQQSAEQAAAAAAVVVGRQENQRGRGARRGG